MTYNAAERRHIKIAEKASKLAETQRRDFIIVAMSHNQGRLWFCDLLERSHIFASSHTGNALNTAFAEGERNIGLQVLNDLMRFCPDSYVQMMRERNDRDSTADRRHRDVSDRDTDDANRADSVAGDGAADSADESVGAD